MTDWQPGPQGYAGAEYDRHTSTRDFAAMEMIRLPWTSFVGADATAPVAVDSITAAERTDTAATRALQCPITPGPLPNPPLLLISPLSGVPARIASGVSPPDARRRSSDDQEGRSRAGSTRFQASIGAKASSDQTAAWPDWQCPQLCGVHAPTTTSHCDRMA